MIIGMNPRLPWLASKAVRAHLGWVYFLLLVLGPMVLVTGCDRKSAVRGVTVKGKVSVEEQPLTKGTVMFTPETARPGQVIALSPIDSAGNFELRANLADGVPPGRYKVTFYTGRPGPARGDGPFARKYSSVEETPFIVEVTEKAEPGAYDFKLTRK